MPVRQRAGGRGLTHPELPAPIMLVIGHRGAAGHVAENTLGSMRRALALGVDGIEFDVRRCDDGLVVLHDATLERTTNGHGACRARSLAELRGLETANGERVPLLGEVLALVTGCALVNVEIKEGEIADSVVAALEQWYADTPRALERVLLSTFDVAATARLAVRRGRMRLGVLYEDEPFPDALSRARDLAADSIHLPLEDVSPATVGAAREAGLAVYVYTVNEAADIAHCHACAVDGVFSDFPDRVIAFERNHGNKEGRP